MPNKNKVSLFQNKDKHNYFYYLDCRTGEGLHNPLLKEIKKISSSAEFDFYINFILKKCININRSFSDAIEFLSIWLEKSPDSLLKKLRTLELKQYFYRTVYGHEGDHWCFSELLKAFVILINENNTANDIFEYLFNTFDFLNDPDTFLIEVIGYDQLQKRIEECPHVFKEALLLMINQLNQTVYIGINSQRYLHDELRLLGKKPNGLTKHTECKDPNITPKNSASLLCT